MIENGYIRYKTAGKILLDDNGNPHKGGDQWSDYIPACIEGNRNTAAYKAESGLRYEKPTYTVYSRRNQGIAITNLVELFDRKKNSLGQFVVRTIQVSPIVNQIRISV
jgi:hypothetical protein